MTCLIQPKRLREMVAVAEKALNVRHTSPILQNVKADWNGHGLRLQTTDLEVSATITDATAETDGHGRAAFPLKFLKDAYKGAKAPIQLSMADADTIQIGSMRVNCSEFDAMPAFPPQPPITTYSFKSDAFKFNRALQRCAPSIAKERARFALNGVAIFPLSGETPGAELVGTDGRRLALSRLDTTKFALPPRGKHSYHDNVPIIPARGCALIAKALGGWKEGESECVVSFNDNEAYIEAAHVFLSVALVDGHYPEYWTVIPKTNQITVTFDRKAMLTLVETARKMTSIDSPTIQIELCDDDMKVTSRSGGSGSFCDSIPATVGVSGPKFGCCPKYLIEGLSGFTGETVTMEYRDSNTGFIIHDGDKENHFFLQMPLEV